MIVSPYITSQGRNNEKQVSPELAEALASQLSQGTAQQENGTEFGPSLWVNAVLPHVTKRGPLGEAAKGLREEISDMFNDDFVRTMREIRAMNADLEEMLRKENNQKGIDEYMKVGKSLSRPQGGYSFPMETKTETVRSQFPELDKLMVEKIKKPDWAARTTRTFFPNIPNTAASGIEKVLRKSFGTAKKFHEWQARNISRPLSEVLRKGMSNETANTIGKISPWAEGIRQAGDVALLPLWWQMEEQKLAEQEGRPPRQFVDPRFPEETTKDWAYPSPVYGP